MCVFFVGEMVIKYLKIIDFKVYKLPGGIMQMAFAALLGGGYRGGGEGLYLMRFAGVAL